MTATARILIVDDDPAAIDALDNALEGMGEVCYATGGADALAVLAEGPVDLVLLDANMPGLDGFATCAILKEAFPALPVIFVTAYGDEGNEIRALEAGAVDFIHKPVTPVLVRARVGVHLKLRTLTAELRALSDRDPLTGIANRRALDERLALEWRAAAPRHQPLGVLMIDIDHFKCFNDHYGHPLGDDCLRQVARALTDTLTQAGALVARYGGEEFVVLLPGGSLADAAALGDRMCAAVRALGIPHVASGTATRVTVSVGAASGVPLPAAPAGPGDRATDPPVAAAPGLPTVEALLARADRALYAAKAAGRDRVCVDMADTAA